MIISHKNKFVFTEVPKTATCSMSSVLSPYNEEKLDKHAYISSLSDCIIFENYFKFAFIRNPWDRSFSYYQQMKKKPKGLKENTKRHKHFLYSTNFNFSDFIKKINEEDLFWDSQNKFLSDNNGNILIDFLGKFENLQNDFDVIMDKIGLQKTKLPFLNFSKKSNLNDVYDEESKDIISFRFKADIELGEYNFG